MMPELHKCRSGAGIC